MLLRIGGIRDTMEEVNKSFRSFEGNIMIMQGKITNVSVLVTSPTSLADAMTAAMERYQHQLEKGVRDNHGAAPVVSMSHNALYVEGIGYSFSIVAVLQFK